MALLIILIGFIWVISIFKYIGTLNTLFLLHKPSGAKIFGNTYASLFTMGADVHLLNNLWNYKDKHSHKDKEIHNLLVIVSKHLKISILLTLSIFILQFAYMLYES